MRRWQRAFFCVVLIFRILPLSAMAYPSRLVPVGSAVTLELNADGVYVVKFDDQGESVPAQDAGIKKGDRIVSVDGSPVRQASELQELVRDSRGNEMIFCVRRGEIPMSFTVCPVYRGEGWRIGVFVQDRIAGIGTVTFFDPETGLYGALGHGVNEAGSAALFSLSGGSTRGAEITDVKKGERGEPGELHGMPATQELGTVELNSESGIFGRLADCPWQGEALPVAAKSEISTGEAEILCTVDTGGVGRYRVEIEELRFSQQDGRSMKLRVTDRRLLDKTGGIVQGMSGSPIIQNGKLIGAVTHVLVQDPTRGYGICMDRMLDACGDLAAAA